MCVVQLVIWVVVCPPSVVRICFSEILYITTSPTQPYEERWRTRTADSVDALALASFAPIRRPFVPVRSASKGGLARGH